LAVQEVVALGPSSEDAGELKEALEAGARFPAWEPVNPCAAA